MKIKAALLAMTALALVTGCSKAGQNNAATANAPAPAVETVNAPEAAPTANETAETGATIDRAFMIGRWGVSGDCSQVMEFAEDGTATPPEGSRWTMTGDQVTVTNPAGEPDTKTVARTGADSMSVTGGGATLSMTRCPAA